MNTRNAFSINAEQRLYVLPCGSGYTCLGFEVAERLRTAVLRWLGEDPQPMPSGTAEHYAAYSIAMARGAAHAAATGQRCPAELTPQLVGLEGRRVEVAAPDGERARFWVGKSTGWMPCHLEVKTRRSSGGAAVYFPAGSTVRVVSAERRA